MKPLERQLINHPDNTPWGSLLHEHGQYVLNGMRPPAQTVPALLANMIIAATDAFTQAF